MGSAKMREVVETAFGAVRSSGVGSSAMRAGMELLALAAEACDEAETSSRRELAMACANEGERVLITVREVFSACGSARSRQTDALKASCVRAARAPVSAAGSPEKVLLLCARVPRKPKVLASLLAFGFSLT